MKFDYDRYIVLFLSIVVILITAGLSFIASFVYVFSIAKNKESLINKEVDTLIVLGKKLKNNLPDEEYTGRLNRVAQVLKSNWNSKVYILGGMTGSANLTESDAGKEVLLNFGIDNERIFLEKDSSHTLENLKNFYDLFDNKNQKILLITNRYHMARSIMMAKGFEINVLGCPAEENFQYTLSNIVKITIEAFYVNFYLVGKYFAIFTSNGKILNRISISKEKL
ncbi:MAG: YdcF family protein [Gammaproteobacteria bacterium]|nr:YdcF family protein [Gammaproteobacteria bacterium]